MELSTDAVLLALSRHIGEENGAPAAQLCREMLGESSPAAERVLRECILGLRLGGQHICGHPSTGYFIARTAEELDRTCVFLYERAMTSLSQISAMKRISLPDLRGQLKLPT